MEIGMEIGMFPPGPSRQFGEELSQAEVRARDERRAMARESFIAGRESRKVIARRGLKEITGWKFLLEGGGKCKEVERKEGRVWKGERSKINL